MLNFLNTCWFLTFYWLWLMNFRRRMFCMKITAFWVVIFCRIVDFIQFFRIIYFIYYLNWYFFMIFYWIIVIYLFWLFNKFYQYIDDWYTLYFFRWKVMIDFSYCFVFFWLGIYLRWILLMRGEGLMFLWERRTLWEFCF